MSSLLLTPDAAAKELAISRTVLYSLLATKDIESVKIGRSRRIPRHALDNYVARLMAERGKRESDPAA